MTDVEFKEVCTHEYSREELGRLATAVEEDWYVEMFADELPMWGYVGEHEAEDFLLGHTDRSKHYLYTHLHFVLGYNGDKVVTANVSALQGGTIEFVMLNSGILSSQVKDFEVFDFPFLFANAKEADAIVDGPFGQKLHAKLADKGIHVATICPGLSITNITQSTRCVGLDAHAEAEKQARATKLYQRRNLTPDKIAKAILDAVEHRRDEVPVGAEAQGARLISRLFPKLSRGLARLDILP